MKKTFFASAIFLCVFVLIVSSQTLRSSQKSNELTKLISESMVEIQTLEAGKTRADLLKVFTTEGGLSTGLSSTYVYRDCPYIKVKVEFEAVGRPARDADGRVTLEEDDRDKIKSISKPYLEWSIAD